MSKDKIFHDKPKVKPVKQLMLGDWCPKRPEDEPTINLYTHARLLPSTRLEKNDEYYETALVGKSQPLMNAPYYRKKDLDGYRLLSPREIIQDGDEFLGWGGVKWERSGSIGDPVDTIYQYRRRIEKPFTDEDIEK